VSGAQARTDADVFCHVHGNKVGEPSGFYDRKTGQTFIEFTGASHVFLFHGYMRVGVAESHQRELLRADWIPEYLGQATQVALRSEMQKARTLSDVEGYIYTFEILGAPPLLSAS
jgi:hypothetical protein